MSRIEESTVVALMVDHADENRLKLTPGCCVLAAGSLREFIQLMLESHAGWCVLDFDHQGVQVFNLLHICRQRFPDTRVLVCSEHRQIDLVTKLLRRGAWDFMTKPLHIRDMPFARSTVEVA